MPGVPLDAKAQVKDGLKRLFRRRHKDDQDTDAQPDSHNANAAAPASPPAPVQSQPERYEDEVQYEPDVKEQTVSPISAGTTSELDNTISPQVANTDGTLPDNTMAKGATAVSPEHSEPVEKEGSPPPATQDAQTGFQAPTVVKEDSGVAVSDGHKNVGTENPTPTQSDVPAINLPEDEKRDGSPTPAMSATSGPLEDYPTLQ